MLKLVSYYRNRVHSISALVARNVTPVPRASRGHSRPFFLSALDDHLIVGIELGEDDNQHGHASDGPVAHAGPVQDAKPA